MKKSILIIFIIISTSFFTIAQNTVNFIEITVEDTIRLKPVKIKYLITENGEDNTNNYDQYKKEENKRAPKDNLSTIEKILTTNKYNFAKHAENSSFEIGANKNTYDLYSKQYNNEGLLIELNNVKELENLYNLLKDQIGINGKITEVFFESKDKYTETLFKNLYAKAQKETQLLASFTELKLGKIISVVEVSSQGINSWMDWYKDIFAMGKYEEGLFGKDLTSVYSRKLTFRFETN